jgi:hypothetical protein
MAEYRDLIQPVIDNKLQQQMETYYTHRNKKLNNLQAKQQQKKTPHNNPRQQQFFPRIKNLSNIKLNKEGTELLNYGLQHSIEKPIETYLTNLTTETEKAIKLLDIKLQNSYRILAAKKLNQILNSNNHHNPLHKRQLYIVKKQPKTCNRKCNDRSSRQ